jgi:L-2,4-diaminobutyrate transaminase
VCGFGRLGTRFGSDFYEIAPDFMTVAKALTSGYFPVSAAVVADRVWEVFEAASAEHGPVAHGYTTSLHPVGAAAALANLDIFEREGLLERAAKIGPGFQRALRAAVGEHPLVGEVRGEGLIAAVELVADRDSRRSFPPASRTGPRLHQLALEEGVICRAVAGDSLAFCPPLVIGEDELSEAVARFRRALDRLADEGPEAG